MPSTQLLTLTEDLTIYHALEQKHRLLDALGSADELELDLMQVGEIDTAGLQLLNAFMRDRAARGRVTTITLPSPTLVEAARQLALAASLGVDSAPGDTA